MQSEDVVVTGETGEESLSLGLGLGECDLVQGGCLKL
jgi:hypothetical protein